MEDEIECTECMWSGTYSELVCSEYLQEGEQEVFNVCPHCGNTDCFEEIEYD